MTLIVPASVWARSAYGIGPKHLRARFAASVLILALAGQAGAQSFDWVTTVQAGGRTYGDWAVSDNEGNVLSSAYAPDGFSIDPGGALCCWAWGDGPYAYKLDENRGFSWTALLASQSMTSGGLATDAAGNAYLAGATRFDWATAVPGSGPAVSSPFGPGALIFKMNPAGEVVWLRKFATATATNSTWLRGVAVRTDGSVLAAGFFDQVIDLDPGPGVVSLTSQGLHDLFLVALDAQGNYLWSRHFGGAYKETISSMEVGPAGDVLLSGEFSGTFPLPVGTIPAQLISAGGTDGLVLHLDANGDVLWAGSLGGIGDDRVLDAAFDPAGNIVLSGLFSGVADLDPGAEVSLANSAGLADGFVEMLTPNHSLRWKRQLGGVGEDRSQSVVFGSGSLYVGGTFTDTVDFGAPGGSATALGADDGYVLKLARDGTFQNFFALGGSSIIADNDRVNNLFMDRSGALLVTGGFTKTVDFDPDPASTYVLVNSAEWSNAYTLRLNDQGAIRVQPANDPALVALGEDFRLTLTVSNSLAATNLSAVALDQHLPFALKISPNAMPNSTCGGTVVAVPGSEQLALTGGALSAGMSCEIGVNVRSIRAGSFAIITEPSAFSDNEDIWPLSTTASTVDIARAGTALIVDSISPNPSMPNETVEFSAHVLVPWSDVLEASGEITVSDGFQSCVMVLPSTSCSLAFGVPGDHEIVLTYSGDIDFLASSETATHSVYAVADLSVALQGHPTHVQDAAAFNFDLVANNSGPSDVIDAQLTIEATGYTQMDWTCIQGCSGGGDSGTIPPISINVDSEIIIRVTGIAESDIDTIETTASITASKPFLDTNPANDVATQAAAFALFFDSFDP